MITLLTATPGGGKTNYAVWDVIKPARESGRTVYTNGIPDLKIPTIEVDRNQLKQWAQRTPVDPDKPEGIQVLDNFEEGSLIVADEVLYLWPSLNYKLPPEDIAYLTQHRKHGLDFFLISQDPGLIHPLVLKNVDRHMHIVHEWQGRFIYEWPEYCSNPKVKTNRYLSFGLCVLIIRCFMANINRLIFVFLILYSTVSYSTTVDLSNQSNFAKSSSGLMWATQASGAPTGALITGNRASVPFSYNVPSGQSLVPVSGVRESNLSLNRIGKAVTNFANRVGPVAVGIAIAGAVCDLTDICNIDDVWQKTVDPDLAGYPQQTDLISYYVANFSPDFPTQELVCAFAADFYNTSVTFNSANNKCEGNGVGLFVSQKGSCPANYIQSGNQCIADFSTENTIATDQHWADAETALNDPQFIQPLFDAGEPLPVDQPDPFPPINTITSTTTKTIRDGDGNITGTEVTENTLTLSDVSSPDSPNLVDVTETKKVTTYDINNNITNTETSVSNPPPIQPPTEEQDQDIEFDDMAENELEEYEIPEIENFSSWGTGTCPPPIDIVTTHWSGQIDTQPICNYAEGLKPFVLLIAALSSAFIVSGSRQNVEV